MKTKLGALALGLFAATAVTIGALGPAAAAQPGDGAEIEAAIRSSDPARLPAWLRHSIIVCAAETIDARAATVKAGLRAGLSLKEIAARHGVRPDELKRGILDCESDYLLRLVAAEELNRAQYHRLLHFLTAHIERIINYHYTPADPVLRDAATEAAASVRQAATV